MIGRPPDSRRIDFAEVFRRVQREMLAQLSVGGMFEHGPSQGDASERRWIALFDNYLPKAYRASSAFIVNSAGQRSQQIDIAIYDAMHSPPLFPHPSGVHIPVESVYAILEVKPSITGPALLYAGRKAASVRKLAPDREILAGILATTSCWKAETFGTHVRKKAAKLGEPQRIDLGCSLDHGAFEREDEVRVSEREDALIFFTLRLIDRLNSLGPAPPADLMKYVSGLKSFQRNG